jgi:hypothetical protein
MQLILFLSYIFCIISHPYSWFGRVKRWNDFLPVQNHENHQLVIEMLVPIVESKEQVLKKDKKVSMSFPGPARALTPASGGPLSYRFPTLVDFTRALTRAPLQCRPSSRRRQLIPHGRALSSRTICILVHPHRDTYAPKMHSQTPLLRTNSRALAAR